MRNVIFLVHIEEFPVILIRLLVSKLIDAYINSATLKCNSSANNTLINLLKIISKMYLHT